MLFVKRLLLIMVVVALTTISLEAQTEKTYVIDAGAYSWLTFNFDKVTALSGKFRARGGSGNDIEVYILDEDGFENWRNGHRASTYYNSGRVTVGRFNVKLSEGIYYLVMNNNFSVVSNKAVTFTFN